MRYHTTKPEVTSALYGQIYTCNHPVYSTCTLFKIGQKGLAIIQQRYDPNTKCTWWTHIDPWIANLLYTNKGFLEYYEKKADYPKDNLYPTVTVRQIMWAFRMKPLEKQRWESTFDRGLI